MFYRFFVQMRRLARNIFTFTLLLVFLTATTGITLFIHTCQESNSSEVLVYPEFTGHSASCCCSDEAITDSSGSSGQEVIDNPECCRNIHLLVKMSFTSVPVSLQNPIPVDLISPYVNINVPAWPENTTPSSGYIPWLDHSPPPGISRIYLFHQIRIPDPVC
jgi:hypothetical protein